MSEKIAEFKRFVSRWIRGLRSPQAPDFDVNDTIWGRIETVISVPGFIILFVSLLSSMAMAISPTLNDVQAWFVGTLALALGLGIYILGGTAIIRVGDFVIRGDDSDDFEYWIEEVVLFAWNAISRPVSWVKTFFTHLPALRRYRRELQAYANAKVKAETVCSDLHRDDAEEIFSGIDDLTMLEALLKN